MSNLMVLLSIPRFDLVSQGSSANATPALHLPYPTNLKKECPGQLASKCSCLEESGSAYQRISLLAVTERRLSQDEEEHPRNNGDDIQS